MLTLSLRLRLQLTLLDSPSSPTSSILLLDVVVVVRVGAVCPRKLLGRVSTVNLEGSFNNLIHCDKIQGLPGCIHTVRSAVKRSVVKSCALSIDLCVMNDEK